MWRPATVYTLVEYQTLSLPAEALDPTTASILWQRYRAQVDLEPPTFKTGNQWRLTPQGWAGHLPLTRRLGLLLYPKVALHNLFGMVEYAYDLQSLHFLPGLAQVETLPALYSSLARLLAHGVLARARQGLYRSYVQQRASLATVRGRIQTGRLAQRAWEPRLPCAYQQLTTDNEENRILAWTLHTVLRSGLCDAEETALLRRAYRAVAGQVTLQPVSAAACHARVYNRMNQDYRPLHGLCAFFLDHSGPSHRQGPHDMVPFLVDLERLYERFVAAWLAYHLPADQQVAAQVRTPVGPGQALHFAIDLVITGPVGAPRWVLDTKYKTPAGGPDPADVAQILAYAQVQQAREAVLVYPRPLAQPLDTTVQGVRLRTLAFTVDGDLREAGRALTSELGIPQSTPAPANADRTEPEDHSPREAYS